MRKVSTMVACLALAATLMPSISSANTTCPGINDNGGYGFTVQHGRPAGPLGDIRHPVINIESGVLIPQPARDLLAPQTDNFTGFRDLGQAGCLGVCPALATSQVCVSDVEYGLVSTNYLTPNATELQVVVHNYPNDFDHYPDPGCLRFDGSPSARCTVSGDKRLNWTLQQGSPLHNDGPRFVSQIVTIPATARSVTAQASLLTHRTAPNETLFRTTYTKAA